MLTVRFLTAVPALRCPLRAFGEPSWTCFIARVTNHSSPGITVSFSGIRRTKLDVLHTTCHQSQQSRRYGVLLGHSASQAGRAPHHRPPITAVPALPCPSRAFGEPSRTSLHEPHHTTVPVVNWQGQDKMSSQLFTALLFVLISGYCVWCLVPRYPGSRICPCACRLGRWGRVARTHCKCCTVMSCGARRLRQDRGTRTPVSCARVSEGTLRTGTSMHRTIQWLSMCPANSRFRSCNYFDD